MSPLEAPTRNDADTAYHLVNDDNTSPRIHQNGEAQRQSSHPKKGWSLILTALLLLGYAALMFLSNLGQNASVCVSGYIRDDGTVPNGSVSLLANLSLVWLGVFLFFIFLWLSLLMAQQATMSSISDMFPC